MNKLKWFVIWVVAIVLAPTVSLAGNLTGIVNSRELIAIGKVLDQPNLYHMQIVRMQGVVRNVEGLMPHDPDRPGGRCNGSYTFLLEDDTGAIEIGFLGDQLNCGRSDRTAAREVAIGDRVIVNGRIHAPGKNVDTMTLPLPLPHTTVQAIAIGISQLEH